MRQGFFPAIAGFMLAILLAPAGMAQQSEQDRLEQLQQQIRAKQQEIANQQSTANELEQQLKQAELDIARIVTALNKTRESLSSNQQQLDSLQKQQQELIELQRAQQGALASQLRSAYINGRHDYAKMLLNQEQAGKFERLITYYQYLNQARAEEIAKHRQLVTQIQNVADSLAKKQLELAELEAQQRQQQNALQQQQVTRQATLNQLNSKIASATSQVERLQANEQALISAIEEAQRQAELADASTQPLDGLASVKGDLINPTDGRMQRLFGKRRQGQVRWKGVLISGREGSPVRAVHQGRVLYADWVKGFGLVTVLDHGEGYMSLYGHNQALLKSAGDVVRGGETIALVGQSGGQDGPSLYFEIRHKGKALNPSSWIGR